MRFRTQIAWTLILQGCGAAAGFLSIALIGIYLGPEAQGSFSLIKVEVAFVGSVAILGLTQSLFYYVQSFCISIWRAKKIAVQLAFLGWFLALGYGVVLQNWKGFYLFAFGFACGAYVFFSILRGVVLAAATTRIFNLMSVMPQGLLLLYAGFAVLLERINTFDVALAFAVAFGVSAAFGIRQLSAASQVALPVAVETRVPNVIKYGLASGTAEVAATISLLLAVKAVESRLGPVELGVFTFAGAIAQGFLLPISYTVPLLFKRWMEHPDISGSLKAGIFVLGILIGLSIVIRYVLNDIVPSSWLGEYSSITYFLWVMLLAAAFDGCQKILAVYANAQGAPWLSATSEILRLVVVAGGLAFWSIQHVRDVAWIVCIAAMTSSLFLFGFRWVVSMKSISDSSTKGNFD